MRRAVVAALALAATGCGSPGATGANRYVDAVNGAQGRLTSTLDRLSGRITDSTAPEQDRRTLQAFDAAVGRAVGTLRAIEPPAKVGDLHRRLVGELDVYGREVRRETARLRSDDRGALAAAQRRLLAFTNEASQRINDTIDAINRRLR